MLATADDYSTRRQRASALVRCSVSAVMDLRSLRGSWAAGDFHLDQGSGMSFSDVDLAASVNGNELQGQRQLISHALLQAGFPLPVSTHREQELASVSLKDARVLKIGEYLSKVHSGGGDLGYVSYWRAKTVLLLLRTHVTESYEAIVKRLGTPDAEQALAVKLGTQQEFPVESARRLIEAFGEEHARAFLSRCILSRPDLAYRTEIAFLIERCKSFTPWLREYILQKMNIEA